MFNSILDICFGIFYTFDMQLITYRVVYIIDNQPKKIKL